jgi:hypothetical protein
MLENNKKSEEKRSPLKTKRLRYAGESLDEEVIRLQSKIFLYFCLGSSIFMFSFVEIWCSFWNVPRQPVVAAILASVTVSYCYFKAVKLRILLQNAKLGRDGEREVGQA